MIELKNISKSFGETKVLKDISATFYPGKTNLIIGTSGSGKTTLTKCIVGLLKPDAGQVLFSGNDFHSMKFNQKKEVRKEIGFLFQGSALFDSMTVEDNITFTLSMFTDMSEEEQLDRANFCLQRTNLENVNLLYPSELGGGMKKRVAIARAIAMNPKYLFCDEPNSGLDPQTAAVIDNLIKEITEEYQITTVVITHDMNSVIEIGDNIIFIYKGEKWWEGDKQAILKTDNKEVVDFVYATKFMKTLRK
ncbi:MAG: ATP-binding cassette domain-containing protein [Flavobacteriales bacterium]|nr:ATP-binding cassette domain-containing protein [Flavobacteriales bacterium]